MNGILLVPAQDVESGVVEVVQSWVAQVFDLPAHRGAELDEPADAWDVTRGQHSSPAILQRLLAGAQPEAARVLGLTERDLFIPMLSFIFGQAQLNGRAALISLARLRQEFYGLPPDPELLRERACKEAVHELGHTFGLTHCPDRSCAMSLSVSIEQVDGKQRTFCPSCATILEDAVRRAGLDRRGQ